MGTPKVMSFRVQGTLPPWKRVLLWAIACAAASAPPDARLAAAQDSSASLTRKLLQRVDPVYPELAIRSNFEGMVVLRIIINAAGTVENVRPASGNPVLIQAAVEAVHHWKYTPATESSVAFVQINFSRTKAH